MSEDMIKFTNREPDIVVELNDASLQTYRIWLTSKDDEFLYDAYDKHHSRPLHNGFSWPSALYLIDNRLWWSHEHDKETAYEWSEEANDDSEKIIVSMIKSLRAEIENTLLGDEPHE